MLTYFMIGFAHYLLRSVVALLLRRSFAELRDLDNDRSTVSVIISPIVIAATWPLDFVIWLVGLYFFYRAASKKRAFGKVAS
jgi:hypothetical protein